MKGLLKEDEILSFNNTLFSYSDLHDLKYRYCLDGYQSGEVLNIETGEYFDLKDIKSQILNFLINIKNEVKTNPVFENISNHDKRYMVEYLNSKANLEFIKYMESCDVSKEKDENIIMYWKIKKQVTDEKDIVFNWNFRVFFKYNILFDLSEFSLLDRGRILSLLYYIDYSNAEINVKFNREGLMKLIEIHNVESFRQFFKNLEEHEIIFRADKTSKKTIDIIFNPFLILKGNSKNITYDICKMFPKTSKKYLGELAVRYLEIENNRLLIARETILED